MPLTPRQREQAASIWGPTWREQHGEESIDEILNHIPPYNWIQRLVDDFERDHPRPAAEPAVPEWAQMPTTVIPAGQTISTQIPHSVWPIEAGLTPPPEVAPSPVPAGHIDLSAIQRTLDANPDIFPMEEVNDEEEQFERDRDADEDDDDDGEEDRPRVFSYPQAEPQSQTNTEMTALEKQTRAVDIKMTAYRGGINHCRYGGTLANDKELAASAGYDGEDAKAYAEGFREGFTTEKGIIEEKEKKNPTVKSTIKRKLVAAKSPAGSLRYTWQNIGGTSTFES